MSIETQNFDINPADLDVLYEDFGDEIEYDEDEYPYVVDQDDLGLWLAAGEYDGDDDYAAYVTDDEEDCE